MKKETLKKVILSNAGVAYLKGVPGTAKTAIYECLSQELNLKYIDVRLSQIDEVEVLGLPVVADDKMSFDYAMPPWLKMALDNEGYDGSLIVFEELNRAELAQRNASMQIMQERRLGSYKLPSNIYMAATGNLGEDDGTEVNELDQAQNNRLLHIKHTLDIPTWREDYADKKVHPVVIDFLVENPSFFLRVELDKDAWASPRSWTHLSQFIINTFGKESEAREFAPMMYEVAHIFVGEAAGQRFIRFCEEQEAININDILKRYDQVEKKVKKLNRAKLSALIAELQKMDFGKMKQVELDNVSKFFAVIPDDEKVSILTDLVVNFNSFKGDSQRRVKSFLQAHKELLLHIKTHKDS